MSSLPKTFKKASFKEHGGRLVIEEAPLQPPGKNELLVKVEACGVCHSDHFAQINGYGAGFPRVPGHEVIGRVAALGEGVRGWKVGDRVGAGWHGGRDGTCKACQMSLFQMCENQAINGITKDGGYAEYVRIQADTGVRVPEGIPAAKFAPMLCAGVTVFNGMRQMNIGPGETVAIHGLGGLGHLGVQYANKFGYRTIAVSSGPDKEPFARQLGAHEYVDTSKGPAGAAIQALGGAALIVTTSPNAEQIPELLNGLGPRGKLLILSVPGEIPINTVTMVTKGLSVHSWPSGHAVDSEDAIKFAQLQGIECLTETFPLDKANEAFDAMLSGKVRFRAVITFD
ncbi:hypothetical protein VTH06DRAFT_4685 [Thermothelomyces fergusii]